MLEIPDSLGRDLDKAAAGKIAPPPIEAFMSDAALEQAEKNTRAATGPVHAEDLTPVSHAEAAARSTFDGRSLPRVSRRRVIPAPYRRDRIAVDHHGKTWQPVRADQVRPGDIVPDIGLVADAREDVIYTTLADVAPAAAVLDPSRARERVASGTRVTVTGAGGVVKTFRPGEAVRVFRS